MGLISNPPARTTHYYYFTMTLRFAAIFGPLILTLVSYRALADEGAPGFGGNPAVASGSSSVENGLRISDNHHYLVDAVTGRPVFLLADTAWNLAALKLEEIDTYLQSRASLGFNTVMFTLNFAPQADEKNAYGQAAYIGKEKTELNPAYFENCDKIIQHAAARGLYVMIYTMWAGKSSGTMNHYTAAQLAKVGSALGHRYGGVPNVIFCAGGESSPPHHIDADRVNAIGQALKEGCAGRNLVTLHPESEYSSSKFFADASWLDFYMSQAKSGSGPRNVLYDAAALVLADWVVTPPKPTMMAEHRYESGTAEDPLIQRRSLYQCVFAGACGHAYGHDALWQMTPHTRQDWMLRDWTPGVRNWTEALNTKAVRQLQYIKKLLFARPYLTRIPDQSLILSGQGNEVATRTQATRDGTKGHADATYLMAYVSAPARIVLRTDVIASRTLNVSWFNPATGATDVLGTNLNNTGSYTLEKREQDGVVIIDDARKGYALP